MSLYIKDLNKPSSCYRCNLESFVPNCPVYMYDSASNYKTECHPDCPLIDIKTPHGDLVDKDEMHWIRDVNGAKILLDMGNIVIKKER